MNGPALLDLNLLTGGSVENVTRDVENLALGDVAHGNRNRCSRVAHFLAAHEAVGGLQSDGTNHVVTEVLGNLERQLGRFLADNDVGLQGVVDAWNRVVRELNVNNRTRHAGDTAHTGLSCFLRCSSHWVSSLLR